MALPRDVFVVGAARTAIGTFGGALKDVPLSDLATLAVKTALERSGAGAASVGHLAMGTVIPTEPRDAYLSRVAAMNAGLPKETPAFNVNRLCGSGLQAIISASQAITLGDCEVAVGAGAESMSRGAYLLPQARWGARMGDSPMLDYVVGALHDPFHKIHMGMTAENVAEQYGISRTMMDELSVESHRRAAAAIAAGRFKEQIVPVVIASKKGDISFDTDEHVKANTTMETLAKMRAAFKKDGSVTAGNASGINDGAGAVVLASADAVKAQNLKPIARLVAYAHAGVEPTIMGIGPVPATEAGAGPGRPEGERPRRDRVQRGLRRAGLRGGQGTRARPGQGEPERLGHLAGPPDRRHRRDHHHQGAVRTAARQGPLRPGDDVHRRRPGHRRDLRARLIRPRRRPEPARAA